MKYTIKNFLADFPNEDVCLQYIFDKRFGKGYVCEECGKADSYYRVKKRKSYACAWCAHQVSPTAGTIFHKSDTKLTLWFFAMFLMSQSKNGVASKELQRQLGVTYKTAWRMNKQIRSLMEQGGFLLSGTVEADETYVGGKGKNNKRGRASENKTPVAGVVQRQGEIRASVVPNVSGATLIPLICNAVETGSKLMTDEFGAYNKAAAAGFQHEKVNHSAKEYVRGEVHTNTIEGFWSQMKRSIDGTYHQVSPKYLQTYVDQFSFLYNHRHSALHLFDVLMARI